MALCKTSPYVFDIRGGLAGNVFKRDSSGLHIIAKPRHIYSEYPGNLPGSVISPAGIGRGVLTKAFTFVSCYYARMFMLETLETWSILAASIYLVLGGVIHKVFGRQLFLHANVARVSRGLEIQPDAYDWFNFYRWLDYNVQGSVSPAIDGLFSEEGKYHLRPFYGRSDPRWFLWSDGDIRWYFSEFPGVIGERGWVRIGLRQSGMYTAYGSATGEIWVWGKGKYKYHPD